MCGVAGDIKLAVCSLAHKYSNRAGSRIIIMLRFDSHATRTRAHFNPQHWFLYHMGLYEFEFEYLVSSTDAVN